MARQQQPLRGRMPSSFWNCGPFSNGGNACTDGAMACGDSELNDDDSIVEQQQQQRQQVPQHQQQLPPQQRVRNLVDGILSPFMNCVQPPLQACVAPAVDWEPGKTSRYQPYAMQSFRSSSNSHRPSSLGIISSRLESSTVLSLQPNASMRTTPNENDVLCGRGNNSNRHAGNINFRDLIAANKDSYGTLTKKEKMLLARQIVDLILNHTDPPARFLGRDTLNGLWYDIGIPRSLEKTSQALREKSAATKAAEKAGATSICSVASFDGSVSEVMSSTDGIEVMSGEEELTDTALSRAVTHKMTNQRNGPVESPPVKVPKHLQKVYSHRPPPPSKCLQTPPLSAELQHRYASQQQFGVPMPPPQQSQQPILPAFRPAASHQPHPYDYHQGVAAEDSGRPYLQYPPRPVAETTRSPYPPPYASHPPPARPIIMSSPPRPSLQHPYHPQQSASSAIVTPHAQHHDHLYGQQGPGHEPLHVTPDHDAPVFPEDVFQNLEYYEKTTISGTRERPHNSIPGGQISPVREQKRQRTSDNAVNTSTESFTDLNTSGESNGTSGSNTSAALTKAIEMQLTLEDRVIRSPSAMAQSFVGGRRSQQPLPRPLKASAALDISADSMDGLAALSTAAFLRLDESY